MVIYDNCPNPVNSSTSGEQNTGSTATTVWFLWLRPQWCIFWIALGFVGNFQFGLLVLGWFPFLWEIAWVVQRHKHLSRLCRLLITCYCKKKYPCLPPLRFDATETAFPLTNWCKYISTFLVGSTLIFESMGVRKSARTPSTLHVVPVIMYHTLGGINGGFFPWDNLYNLLKR